MKLECPGEITENLGLSPTLERWSVFFVFTISEMSGSFLFIYLFIFYEEGNEDWWELGTWLGEA